MHGLFFLFFYLNAYIWSRFGYLTYTNPCLNVFLGFKGDQLDLSVVEKCLLHGNAPPRSGMIPSTVCFFLNQKYIKSKSKACIQVLWESILLIEMYSFAYSRCTFVAIAVNSCKSVVVKMANLAHCSDSVVFFRFLFSIMTLYYYSRSLTHQKN